MRSETSVLTLNSVGFGEGCDMAYINVGDEKQLTDHAPHGCFSNACGQDQLRALLEFVREAASVAA